MKPRTRAKARATARPRGPQLRRPTGAQRVYAALRHAIIALDIEPGAALEEERLCRQYKVSRTPLREALIRLASEGLIELEPNRGAKVAALQFVDVVDHYEAMDVLQPVIWHFAAVRRTEADLDSIQQCLEAFRAAVSGEDTEAIVQSNYELHAAFAAASHNRCLEKADRQMLVDKLRVAQHAVRGLAPNRGHALAMRFTGTLQILERAAEAIARGDAIAAERLAREHNAHVRKQIMDILSASLGANVKFAPPQRELALVVANSAGGGQTSKAR